MDTGQSDFTDRPSVGRQICYRIERRDIGCKKEQEDSVASGNTRDPRDPVAVCCVPEGKTGEGRKGKGDLAATDHISDTVPESVARWPGSFLYVDCDMRDRDLLLTIRSGDRCKSLVSQRWLTFRDGETSGVRRPSEGGKRTDPMQISDEIGESRRKSV